MMRVVATDAAPRQGWTADEAVEALYRAEYRALVRLAALLLDDVGAGEEVVQDAFVALHLQWDRVRDPARAPAWLRSAVLNGARSRLRRRRVRERMRLLPPPETASPEAAAVAGDEHRRVLAALRRLPERQREVLVLRHYLDQSEAEIATTLGVSPGTVKTHAHRGLAALAAALEETR